MKKLQDFENIHKNDDIYILASGKSTDYIDNSFFNNKIIIGINQVYKKTKCNYLVRKESEMIKNIIEENKDTVHFISKGRCGSKNNVNENIINALPNDLKQHVVIYDHNYNRNGSDYNNLPHDGSLITTYSTITTGIHLAAYMGAKNIILIGHDCGTLDGECNFKGYHTEHTYKIAHGVSGEKRYKNWLKEIENNTLKLKKLLKQKYDCNVYSLNPFVNFGLEGHVYTR